MKKKLLFFVLTYPFLVQPLTKEYVKTFSITQAEEQALQNKPSIHAYQYEISNYQRQQKSTLSTYLPNISLSESFYNTNNTTQIKSSFGLQASQTILNLAQIDYYKLYGTYVRSAKHQKESHKDEIKFAIQIAFLDAWLLQQKLPLILLHYNSAKKTYELSKNQFSLELLDKNDWLKAKYSYSNALATVNSYQDDIAQTEKNLEYYTGITFTLLPCEKKQIHPTALTYKPQKSFALKSFEYYYKKALANRNDLKAKQDSIDAESLTSQYYTKQYVPSVSLFGTATKSTIRQGDSTWTKDAGVKISWNVFDGLSNYFNKSAADARKMKTILEKNDLKNQIKLDVQTAYTNLQKEIKNLIAQKTSYKQAKNEYILKKQQFDIGIISDVDMQTAQYSFENARHSWLTQLATTNLKHYTLLYTCGYPEKA